MCGSGRHLGRDLKKGPLYEAVLVTIRQEFALVLIVIGANAQELEVMIHSAQIRFADFD